MRATETVLRDGWEVIGNRRILVDQPISGDVLKCAAEQSADRDSKPRATIEASGRFDFQADGFMHADNDFRPFDDLINDARREAQAYSVDKSGRRVRPRILETLCDHLGASTNAELAARLNVKPLHIALARAGFTPFGSLAIKLTDAIFEAGLAVHRDHAYRLAITPHA